MKKSALKPVWKALGTIAKQHAMESAAMDSQRHVVQEATRRSRDEVVAGTIAEMTTLCILKSKTNDRKLPNNTIGRASKSMLGRAK